ncbi:Nitrite reductase [NAD(P)H] [Sporomusa rhizae]|uniref:nitrite reductase n=1 Tax=Sporomusa rhizae TaxID=357999 RepID=UPI00352A6183
MSKQNRNLPLVPHLPGGFVSPALLHQLANIAEQYGGTIKVAGNSLIILGLSPSDRTQALHELGLETQSLSAKAIRSVAVCAGKPHCLRAIQDSTALGLLLEDKFYGTDLPGKLRIGVSGCPNCCSETFVKDIGLYGVAGGYTVVVGGNSGRKAKAGQILTAKVADDDVVPLLEKIIRYYQTQGHPGERLGQMIDRLGFEDFAAHFGVN